MTASDLAGSDTPGAALAAAYAETYAAILDIFDSLTDQQLATVIPACPAWTVRDLVAHLSGVAADASTARFPAVDPHGPWAERQAVVDAFTAGHIEGRRGLTMNEILAEWARHLRVLAPMLRHEQPFPAGSWPSIDWVVVSDIAAHAQDLRGALQLPGDRDSAGVALGLGRYLAGLSQRITAAGLPALRLCTADREHVAGRGLPTATVTASRWELFRALGSRRSPAQIRALSWSGDAGIYLPLLPTYGVRSDDLIE
jgi:uncharacterized protein (TIGR03083 family)